MGQFVDIIEFPPFPRSQNRPVILPSLETAAISNFARLIPGESHDRLQQPEALEVVPEQNATSLKIGAYGLVKKLSVALSPRFLERINPGMLVPAAFDLSLLTCVFFVSENLLLKRVQPGTLNSSVLWIYLIAFTVFAIEEGLYSIRAGERKETAAAIRTTAWALLFVLLSGHWSLHGAAFSLAFSGVSLLALLARRQICLILCPPRNNSRKLLIVGNGPKAQQVADALRCDKSSTRSVAGFIAENDLRNVYGPSMLRRVAREEFVDELVIASSDPAIVRIAIEEGRRNALDVRIAPEVGMMQPAREMTFETVGGIPLLKLQEYRLPEHKLAVKRIFDIVAALLGLIILSPLLILIAALIKLDSRGPVLYRAPRTGQKGRQFLCFKLRTMVPEADAIKHQLRRNNERKGAFFKLNNDPRITRIGRVLRRYSLDELPQLWNVVLGDMSLVGPRPHPPDDVSFYELHHLQRLDFVPGITGLWQVKARRDPSFERSVALDVEYIKTWNLWLDARLLWQTIFVVLEGSGA